VQAAKSRLALYGGLSRMITATLQRSLGRNGRFTIHLFAAA
jgi:hypothetical protein